jgi:hypothetical protein
VKGEKLGASVLVFFFLKGRGVCFFFFLKIREEATASLLEKIGLGFFLCFP